MKLTIKDYFRIPSKAPHAWLLYEYGIVLPEVLLNIITIFFFRPAFVTLTCLGDCSNQSGNLGIQYIPWLCRGIEIIFLILFLIQVIYNTYVLARKKPKLYILKVIKNAFLAITPLVIYFLVTLFLTFFFASTLPNMATPDI